MPWTREEKYFASLNWRQNHSKPCSQNFVGSLTLTIIPRKAKFIVGYTNFKLQGQKGENPSSGGKLTVRCSNNVDAVRDSVGRSLKKSLRRRSPKLGISGELLDKVNKFLHLSSGLTFLK